MARNEVYYEWAVEHTDPDGDIIDIEHGDTLVELGNMQAQDAIAGHDTKPVLTLIRHIGNQDDGELDRTYAYPIQSRLPAEFEDGKNIPKRFREELAKFCMT
jgi:hypothetical protein